MHGIKYCPHCCTVTQSVNWHRLGSSRSPNAWKLSSIVPIFPSHQDPVHCMNNNRSINISSECPHHQPSATALPTFRLPVGFRTGRSTVSALLLTIHEWLKLLESGKDICAIFLDYRKSFDSVSMHPTSTLRLTEIVSLLYHTQKTFPVYNQISRYQGT